MRPTRLLAVGGGLLIVTGLVASGCAKSTDKAVAGAKVINVTLTDEGCKPDSATQAAGPMTFKVTNTNATEADRGRAAAGRRDPG